MHVSISIVYMYTLICPLSKKIISVVIGGPYPQILRDCLASTRGFSMTKIKKVAHLESSASTWGRAQIKPHNPLISNCISIFLPRCCCLNRNLLIIPCYTQMFHQYWFVICIFHTSLQKMKFLKITSCSSQVSGFNLLELCVLTS